jgi:thioredoxin-related protein
MQGMRMKMKTCWILLVVLGFYSPAAPTNGNRTEHRFWTPLGKFDEKRDPASDLQLAIKEARVSKRRILLDVGGEWCIWCRRLDTLFIRNPDLSEFLHANFVVVKVHYDNKVNTNEKFLSRYPKIPGYPHVFVLDKNGKLLKSQDTAELEEGKGHSKEKVMTFLQLWAPKKR